MTFEIKIWQDEEQIWRAESKEGWSAWGVTPTLLLQELIRLLDPLPADVTEWLASLNGST